MRVLNPRLAGVAALVALTAAALSGCELREGHSSEYGKTGAGPIGYSLRIDDGRV